MAAHDPYTQLDPLPEEVRKKVLDYITELMDQWEQKKASSEAPKEKRRIFGLMKGQIHIADDFDEPLDDFKEYME